MWVIISSWIINGTIILKINMKRNLMIRFCTLLIYGKEIQSMDWIWSLICKKFIHKNLIKCFLHPDIYMNNSMVIIQLIKWTLMIKFFLIILKLNTWPNLLLLIWKISLIKTSLVFLILQKIYFSTI